MTGRHPAEKRVDEIHQGVGQADLAHPHRSTREQVLCDLPGGEDRVPQREWQLGQGKGDEPSQNISGVGDRDMGQGEANPPPKGAEIHVEEQGVNDPEQDHQQRGRVFPVSQQREREHKAGGGQAISGKTSGLDIILQRQRRKLQSQPELDAPHHALGNRPGHPLDETRSRQDQHHHADRQPAPIENPSAELLRDHEHRHGFQRLNRHRHSIDKPRDDLHEAKHDQHAGRVEFCDEDHAHQQGKIRANVPKRP